MKLNCVELVESKDDVHMHIIKINIILRELNRFKFIDDNEKSVKVIIAFFFVIL